MDTVILHSMCEAVAFYVNGRQQAAVAGIRGMALPVVTRGGGLAWVEWGAAANEEADLHIDPSDGPGRLLALPRGYWVSLADVRGSDSRWWGRKVQPVKIAATAFLIWRSHDGIALHEWVPLKAGEYLQGALARIRSTRRVYLVTVPAPPKFDGARPCWPRIVRAR